MLTAADLLIGRDNVEDDDQLTLLNEFRRFLSHESAGVKGFDRMPSEWTDLNRLISSGGVIGAKSHEARAVIEAWHQETRDLSMILSRLTERVVGERLPKKHRGNPALRAKDEYNLLREKHQLVCLLDVPDAAAPVEILADLTRRCIDVGMTIKAPADKKSTKARLNWLLRRIKAANVQDLNVRLLWPGASEPTQFSIEALRENVEICNEGKAHLVVRGFHVFVSRRIGVRFIQQTNFIADLESIVPAFYGEIGSELIAWSAPAPKIKHSKDSADEVSTEAIAEEAENFRVEVG